MQLMLASNAMDGVNARWWSFPTVNGNNYNALNPVMRCELMPASATRKLKLQSDDVAERQVDQKVSP